MRKILLAATIAAFIPAQLLAGSYSPAKPDPVVVPEVVIEEAASSSNAGIIVPLFFLVVLAAAASSGGGGGGGLVVSDARLKTDILPSGTTADGLQLYTFRYIGSDALYEGVMAQDVMTHRPEAIVALPGGFMGVNYAMLGIELRVID